MRTLVALGTSLVVVACNSGRTASGTLVAQHPDGTSAMAISATNRVRAPLAADGSFSLQLNGTAPYRLHFVSSRNGRTAILATARSGSRAFLIRPGSGTGPIRLGNIGRGDQKLAVSATGDQCTSDGDAVDVEDQGDAGGDEGDNASDAGEQDTESHDNVCDDGGDHQDGGDDEGEADGGEGD